MPVPSQLSVNRSVDFSILSVLPTLQFWTFPLEYSILLLLLFTKWFQIVSIYPPQIFQVRSGKFASVGISLAAAEPT